MADQELATQWDADHRLAAVASFAAGMVVVVGAALWLTLGMALAGQTATAFLVTLVAGLLLITDVALLVFVVGLAHALTRPGSFGLVLTTAVASLATAVSATLHLLWGHLASVPKVEADIPSGVADFVTWLALNLWLMPLFGLLVGATLLALAMALRASDFTLARRLGTASAVVGGILVVLGPFAGFSPDQSAIVAVIAILVAAVGISGLLAVALLRLGVLLWRSRGRS